ncbi:MAG TPA: hypothetical protein VKF15_06455 [Nitrososphaerales archaeon]|nr:hypothetical protein [Nitrososphaerales archaeon]
MDSEFLGLSLLFVVIGVAGIVLFYGPMNSAGDSCYCLIPSPEPGAAQGTSSIFLALGILFFPMGLMKGGLPSLRKAATPAKLAPAPGVMVTPPVPMSSGKLLATGIILVVLGADAVLIPGYLVLKSIPVTGGGILLTALGGLAMYIGSRKPKP